MKNLAKCTPTEFVTQTAKIKDAVKNWLDVTKILDIRQHKPTYQMCAKDASPEVRAETIKINAQLEHEQAKKNMSDILDSMLVEHPQETLEVLALCCFVEPSDIDNHPIDEYMDCIMDMLESKAVIRFFSLLAQVQMQGTST